jgi:hypothetical protein
MAGTLDLLGGRVLLSDHCSQSIEGSDSPLTFFFCRMDATS